MMNINGHIIAVEDFNPAVHVLEPGYFAEQMRRFEKLYKAEFRDGWEFYDAYSNGCTDPGNLDFEEWSFICEHLLGEFTKSRQPPGECVSVNEEPESNSGFSFGGGRPCLIRCDISELWKKQSRIAAIGRTFLSKN